MLPATFLMQDLDVAEELIEEWFVMVQDNNKLVRDESTLVYELRDLELIEQHEQLEREIRKRMSKDGEDGMQAGGGGGDAMLVCVQTTGGREYVATYRWWWVWSDLYTYDWRNTTML